MTRALGWMLAGALVGACRTPPVQGTSVGNPGDASLTAAPGTSIAWTSARLFVEQVVWMGCGTADDTVILDADIDLTEPFPFVAPVGKWCGVQVQANSDLVLDGTRADNRTAQVQLALTTIDIPSLRSFDVDPSSRMLIELGQPGWLDGSELPEYTGGDPSFGPDDDDYEDVVVLIERGSAVYYSQNGDFAVDDDERRNGPAAAGEARTFDDEHEDSDGDSDGD